MNTLTALFFVYAGNIRFGMGLDPSREPELLAYIDRCTKSNDIIYFTDADGVNHAAIDAKEVKKTESLIKTPEQQELFCRPAAIPDGFVEYHLYFFDGRIESRESRFVDHRYIFSCLTRSVSSQEATLVDQRFILGDNLIGEGLVGYSSTAGISCFCPTNRLLIAGCPSSTGKQCVTKLSMTPKRWK